MSDIIESGETIVYYRLERSSDGEDLLFEDFNWPRLKEFIDGLTSALEAMSGEVKPDTLMPVNISKGSVKVAMRGKPPLTKADARLRQGPDDSWSLEMHQKTHNLYRFLRKNGLKLRSGPQRGVVLLFRMPEKVEYNNIVEVGRRVGRVMHIGGKEGHVWIEFDDAHLGMVTCKAGPEKATQISPYLYKRAFFQLEWYRHPVTLENPRPPTILDFKPIEGSDTADPREALLELLGDRAEGFSLREFRRKAGKEE